MKANTILGTQRATAGDNVSVCTNIWLNRMKRMYVKARAIPNARFQPIPPLRFCDESATPMIVRMNAEKGRAKRVCFSIRANLTLLSPRMERVRIISLSSSYVKAVTTLSEK